MRMVYTSQPEEQICRDLLQAIIDHRDMHIILFLGGGTVVKIYQYISANFESFYIALRSAGLRDLSHLTIAQTEDIWIPDHDNPYLNFNMIRNTGLIDKICALGGRYTRIVNSQNMYADAESYNDFLIKTNGHTYKILIGGVGKDGRTCGLFPRWSQHEYQKTYYEQNKNAIAVRSGLNNPNMITISPQWIMQMNSCLLYMVGDDKRNVLNSLLYENKKECKIPAKVYQQHANANLYTDIFII